MRNILYILAGTWMLGTALAGPVDINSADVETLARELNGIGQSRAQAIVEYRQQYGAFQSPDDLLDVAGIGERIVEQNRANIVVGDSTP